MKFMLLFIKIDKFMQLKGQRQIHRERADDMSLTFSLTKESKSKNSNYIRKFLIRPGENLLHVQCCRKESETLVYRVINVRCFALTKRRKTTKNIPEYTSFLLASGIQNNVRASNKF